MAFFGPRVKDRVEPPVSDPYAVCMECERLQEKPVKDLKCPTCGTLMTRFSAMDSSLQESFRVQAWFYAVRRAGKHGPSPGGAAAFLGCDRTMINKLVDYGVLERSVYEVEGGSYQVISKRSLEEARRAKEETGKWTSAKRWHEGKVTKSE